MRTVALRGLAWMRADPVRGDGLLAGILVTLGFIGLVVTTPDPAFRAPDWFDAVLVLIQGGALVWRRRHPIAALALSFGASIVIWVVDYEEVATTLALIIALYSVAAWAPRRAARRAGVVTGVTLAVVLVGGMLFGEVEELTLDVFVGNFVIFATAFVLGENVRNRRERLIELEDQAAAADAARTAEARRAVIAERARIARELHDVVAHSVSVMVVQAGAARRVLDRDPAAATESLCAIEDVGRQSLTELRRLLGVLRRDGDRTAARVPQPTIAEVGALVASTREAGLEVDLVVDGDARALSAGVDLSAYRIVQEALTNTLKHAGPAARAAVRVTYTDEDLQLEVVDDGRGVTGAERNSGHGLVGMRERVNLYGGDLKTGNRPGGGYVVRARLPLAPAAAYR